MAVWGIYDVNQNVIMKYNVTERKNLFLYFSFLPFV